MATTICIKVLDVTCLYGGVLARLGAKAAVCIFDPLFNRNIMYVPINYVCYLARERALKCRKNPKL